MFDKILVPLDGSGRGEAVLRQAEPLLKRPSGEVILLRAVSAQPSFSRFDYGRTLAEDRAEAQEYLDKLIRRLDDEGMKVRGWVREGAVAETILETAEKEGTELIAMSTHGRSGIPRWVLGSVAEKVIRGTTAPVLLFRSFGPTGEAEAPRWVPFRKILVTTDGSRRSLAVIPYVEELADVYSAEVTVLYVEETLTVPVEPSLAGVAGSPAGPTPWAFQPLPPAAREELLQSAVARFTAPKFPVATLSERGDPAAEIIKEAHDGGFDLVAMATHGRHGVGRWVFGSVTEKVLRHGATPLLVVRPASETE